MASTNSIDPATAAGSPQTATRLSGNIGVFELVCTVLAYNGPIVVFLGFIPVAILLGNGVGMPVTIVACGVVITCLAVGLTSMARKLPTPGGFYALISAGLGKVVGLSAGFTALMCYYVACISAYALGGIAMRALMADIVHGRNDQDLWIWEGVPSRKYDPGSHLIKSALQRWRKGTLRAHGSQQQRRFQPGRPRPLDPR